MENTLKWRILWWGIFWKEQTLLGETMKRDYDEGKIIWNVYWIKSSLEKEYAEGG